MDTLLCSKCDWRPTYNSELYKVSDWLPPCPVCGSFIEGFKIINANI